MAAKRHKIHKNKKIFVFSFVFSVLFCGYSFLELVWKVLIEVKTERFVILREP